MEVGNDTSSYEGDGDAAAVAEFYASQIERIAEIRETQPRLALDLSEALVRVIDDDQDFVLPLFVRAYIHESRMHAWDALDDSPGAIRECETMFDILEQCDAVNNNAELASGMMERGSEMMEKHRQSASEQHRVEPKREFLLQSMPYQS